MSDRDGAGRRLGRNLRSGGEASESRRTRRSAGASRILLGSLDGDEAPPRAGAGVGPHSFGDFGSADLLDEILLGEIQHGETGLYAPLTPPPDGSA